MKWRQIVHPDLITAGGMPAQVLSSDGYRDYIFLYRESGPGDNRVPRRVVGVGISHDKAMENLMRVLSRVDRRAEITWAHDTEHPANRASEAR